MRVKTQHFAVNIPECDRLAIDGEWALAKSRWKANRTIAAFPKGEITLVDSERGNATSELNLLLDAVKQRPDSYGAASLLSKIKAELRSFNANTGAWK